MPDATSELAVGCASRPQRTFIFMKKSYDGGSFPARSVMTWPEVLLYVIGYPCNTNEHIQQGANRRAHRDSFGGIAIIHRVRDCALKNQLPTKAARSDYRSSVASPASHESQARGPRGPRGPLRQLYVRVRACVRPCGGVRYARCKHVCARRCGCMRTVPLVHACGTAVWDWSIKRNAIEVCPCGEERRAEGSGPIVSTVHSVLSLSRPTGWADGRLTGSSVHGPPSFAGSAFLQSALGLHGTILFTRHTVEYGR
jgi:hypothetical protein